MDKIAPERRSWNMSRIRGKNTAPEIAVRRAAHALGFRFRLHRPELPGTPDLVFSKRKTVIFVHGCFWHRHEGCKHAYLPKSNSEYWNEKFEKNTRRDQAAEQMLRESGWRVAVVWECETKDEASLKQKLIAYLSQ